ncbi:MAG: hypothetical protein IKM24_07145, partial [Clostridia bacterium]|nr:hypothetical protein [Clostridia bacterium]
MMKVRILSVVLAILMILAVFTACGSDTDKEPTDSSSAEQTTVLTEQTEADTTESTTQDDISVNTDTAGYINSKESFVNTVSGLVDLSKYEDLHTSDSGSFVIYAYYLEYDYKQDYDLDYKV